jgi:hypothetical protein
VDLVTVLYLGHVTIRMKSLDALRPIDPDTLARKAIEQLFT